MNEIQYIDLKEKIAQILFYGVLEQEWNPEDEDDCNRIAELILDMTLQACDKR
jgi:hypothetical protein